MNRFKFIIISIITILLLNTSIYAGNKYINITLTYDYQKHNYNAEEVFVAINGEKITDLTMPPIILNDYTLVPAREVFESMGAKVEWKKDVEQVFVTYGSTLVVIPINSDKAYVNGQAKKMDTKAKIINNKTMIPLRFVSSALDFKIEWDSKTRIANIITKDIETTTVQTTVTTEQTTETTTAMLTTKAEVTTVLTTIKAQPVTSANNEYIWYDYDNDALYIKNTGLALSDISEQDSYNEGKYIITINKKLQTSNTAFTPESDYVKSCTVSVGNKTTITFNENRIIAMDIRNVNGYICFKPIPPKEKYNKIVIVDAGHGGSQPGAMGNDIIEKDITLAMANSLKSKLDSDGRVKCYMTRPDDRDVGLEERAEMANDIGGDMFISIHINSVENNTEANGTETYSLYPNDLGNGLTSYAVAEEMLDRLIAKLGTSNRKVKSNTYVVLKVNKIPAALCEIGFLTNENDAEIMKNGVDKVGQALYDGIINLFNEYPSVR